MKNVFRILKADLRALFKQFFATVIAIAITIIPALYAWVNIYANWDPYGNTGNIKIAVVSLDEGYTKDNGEYINIGQEVLDGLSTSIGWTIMTDADEAYNETDAGHYYGAIIISKNLSRNMYNLADALSDEDPELIFYQNYKINAVGNKIAETAASTFSHNVQVKYIGILLENIFSKMNDLGDQFDAQGTTDSMISSVRALANLCESTSAGLSSFITNADTVSDDLAAADTSNLQSALGSAGSSLQDAAVTLPEFEDQLVELSNSLVSNIDNLQIYLNNLDTSQITDDQVQSALDQLTEITSGIIALRSSIPATNSYMTGTANLTTGLDNMSTIAQNASSTTQKLTGVSASAAADTGTDSSASGSTSSASSSDTSNSVLADTVVSDLNHDLNAMRVIMNDVVIPGIPIMLESFSNILSAMSSVSYALQSTLSDMDPVMDTGADTLSAAADSMSYVKDMVDDLGDTLTRIANLMEDIENSEALGTLIDMLGGDTEMFAEFFTEPVQVTSYNLYPVENYGSAMTPFYSVLAVWVGCVVNMAIMKREANPRGLKNVTEAQLYWARFLLLFILNFLQAMVIFVGDLLILKVQCLHPVLFLFAAVVTAFVFTALIYSLCLAFGDVGKAIVVVVMVLQIAGSSGTYPIEILKKVFEDFYLLFPFPYAINAFREAMFGLYHLDYLKYLGELCLFGIFGIFIGLRVRKPFVKVNEFIEEEMEDTGVL